MKVEFTRAEVEGILLAYASNMTNRVFNKVDPGAYRSMPDTFTVSYEQEEPKDAAQ